MLAQAVYQHDSMFYQGMQLGMYETIGLGWQKADQYVENINKVTPEQVQAVAKKYLMEEHLNVAYMEPQNMATPANNAHKHPAK